MFGTMDRQKDKHTKSRVPSFGKLVQGGMAYSLVSIVQRGLSFLLLPFYAHVLSPNEFGQIALISTISALLGTVLTFGLDSAVFRQYFLLEDRPDTRNVFITTIGLTSLIVPVAVTLLIFMGAAMIWRDSWSLELGAVFLGCMATAVAVYGRACVFPLLRAEHRLKDFVLMNSLSMTASIVLTMLFILVMGWGPSGWFAAQLIGALVMVPYGLHLLSQHWTKIFDTSRLAESLKFGIPIVPHQLAHWSLSLADRAILGLFVSTAVVGVYSMGYQFATILGILLTSLNQTVMPEYARAVNEKVENASRLKQIVTIQVLTTGTITLSAALIVPPLIEVILPEAYWQAAELIPWFALGYFFYGLYYIPMNVITLIKGDTKWNWVFTIVSGIIAAVLNFLLIPSGGILVPAIVTAVGYATLLLLITAYGHLKYGSLIELDIKKTGLGLVLIATAYASSKLLPSLPSTMAVVSSALICSIVAIALTAIMLGSTGFNRISHFRRTLA